jgi:hypothetical protein
LSPKSNSRKTLQCRGRETTGSSVGAKRPPRSIGVHRWMFYGALSPLARYISSKAYRPMTN